LNNNVENLQTEHGINLNAKPTYIQSIIQQQQMQPQMQAATPGQAKYFGEQQFMN